LPEYLAGLDAGTATFDISAEGRGMTLARAGLDFTASGVSAKLADGPVAKFDQMSGVLTLAHAGNRWSLSGRRVRAVRRDPESAFDISWSQGSEGLLDVSARASYLRVDTLLPLAGFLPQKELREKIREIAPTGEWIDTSLGVGAYTRPATHGACRFRPNFAMRASPRWDGPRDCAACPVPWPAMKAAAMCSSIPMAPYSHGRRSFRNLSIWKSARQSSIGNAAPMSCCVASPGWQIKTHDAEVHGLVSWRQASDDSSPVLTLASTVQNGNVAGARNYFPRALIAPPALAWLNRAFVAGHLSRADAVLQGPLRHYPFRDGSGLFLVRVAIDGMTLDYSDGWPAAENVTAQAEFRNEGLDVHMISGRLGTIDLGSVEARFADFKNGELRIKAGARGEAAAAIDYLRATPLDAMAEHAFSSVEAAGMLDANVDLFLPFKDFAHRRVLVHGQLDGATLNEVGSPPKATDMSGEFDIDNAQVVHADIHGRLLGGAFQMQARVPRNRPATRTQLEFRGALSADAVRSALAVPATISSKAKPTGARCSRWRRSRPASARCA
jgi:hypothetical protein